MLATVVGTLTTTFWFVPMDTGKGEELGVTTEKVPAEAANVTVTVLDVVVAPAVLSHSTSTSTFPPAVPVRVKLVAPEKSVVPVVVLNVPLPVLLAAME